MGFIHGFVFYDKLMESSIRIEHFENSLYIFNAIFNLQFLLTQKFLTTNESFQMRYYVWIFLKGHANCQG